jgi:hypothetical protein
VISVRALSEQAAALNELRSRAGTLLAAASLVASVLGSQALHRVGFDAWTVAALGALSVTLVACIFVLWPRDGLIFSLSGPEVYENLFEFSTPEIHRRLAYWVQEFRANNQAAIGGWFGLTNAYRLAAVATVVQVILWGGAFTR